MTSFDDMTSHKKEDIYLLQNLATHVFILSKPISTCKLEGKIVFFISVDKNDKRTNSHIDPNTKSLITYR